MTKRLITIAAMSVTALALTACLDSTRGGTVSQQLGIAQSAPDEFLIIARAPIEMPQSFDLPRPEPGAPARNDIDPEADAHSVLFDDRQPRRLSAPSGGEQVLLSGADAQGDNSTIRATLEEEAPPDANERYGLSSLFGYRIPAQIGENGEDLDPVIETEELRNRGLLTPTAPPPPPSERGAGFTFTN